MYLLCMYVPVWLTNHRYTGEEPRSFRPVCSSLATHAPTHRSAEACGCPGPGAVWCPSCVAKHLVTGEQPLPRPAAGSWRSWGQGQPGAHQCAVAAWINHCLACCVWLSDGGKAWSWKRAAAAHLQSAAAQSCDRTDEHLTWLVLEAAAPCEVPMQPPCSPGVAEGPILCAHHRGFPASRAMPPALQELLAVGSMRSDAAGTPGQNGYPGGKRGSPFQAGPFAERPFTEEGDVDSTPQWGR